jgi:hypothetical protein
LVEVKVGALAVPKPAAGVAPLTKFIRAEYLLILNASMSIAFLSLLILPEFKLASQDLL